MDETKREGDQATAGVTDPADAPIPASAPPRPLPAAREAAEASGTVEATETVEPHARTSDADRLQWPPPDDELEGWEVISLAAQGAKARQANAVSFGDEASAEPEPARPGSLHTERVIDNAAPPNETTAERLKRLVAATAPAELVAAEPADQPWDAPEPPAPEPAERGSSEFSPGPLQPEVAFGPRKWALPLGLALGLAVGGAAGWFARPALIKPPTTAVLVVETAPPGAAVTVDATPRGKTPLRLDLPPGDRRLVVESNGTKREVTVRLAAGSDVARYFEFGSGVSSDQLAPGSLLVETRPAGARVVVAGEARGTTPVTVTGLAPGLHDVLLSSADRTVTQRVEIQAGRQSVLVVPMATATAAQSGWIAVRSPIPLRILEGGSVVGTTEVRRIMLPAGRHDLELVNERLEVRLTRSIAVQGGQELSLDVALPQGRLSVNAQPWAEVFVGSERLGETPIANASLPVGDHEIVFRHPQLGERRQTVTVRANTPTRVAVSFTP